MKGSRTHFGDWRVINPNLVRRLSLIYHINHMEKAPESWVQVEKAFAAKVPEFREDELFFEEVNEDKGTRICFAFRYYTPATNRLRSVGH